MTLDLVHDLIIQIIKYYFVIVQLPILTYLGIVFFRRLIGI